MKTQFFPGLLCLWCVMGAESVLCVGCGAFVSGFFSGTPLTFAAETLQKLQEQHPLPGVILRYRRICVMLTKYVQHLPKYARRDRDSGQLRIHAEMLHTNTPTVRLAYSHQFSPHMTIGSLSLSMYLSCCLSDVEPQGRLATKNPNLQCIPHDRLVASSSWSAAGVLCNILSTF